MSAVADRLREFVDTLVASIDQVTGRWSPCWSTVSWLPSNALTGKQYRGINTLLLLVDQQDHAYPTSTFATYKQWVALGGQVRKGEHGVRLVKWVERERTDPSVPSRLVPLVFVVFNAAQQDGWAPSVGEVRPMAECLVALDEHIMSVHAPTVQVGSPAYARHADVVLMPPRESFASPEAWASTFSHEMIHWTAHPTRLNREPHARWGDDNYAFEELVAEIGSSFVTSAFGVPAQPTRDDHLLYIKHWAARLKADPSLILSVAQAAQRATDFLVTTTIKEAVDVVHELESVG